MVNSNPTYCSIYHQLVEDLKTLIRLSAQKILCHCAHLGVEIELWIQLALAHSRNRHTTHEGRKGEWRAGERRVSSRNDTTTI